jgi:hypothetical protein
LSYSVTHSHLKAKKNIGRPHAVDTLRLALVTKLIHLASMKVHSFINCEYPRISAITEEVIMRDFDKIMQK